MAGLIPQSFIDDLLHRVDIVEVIDKRVNLKKAGKNYTACCPFHNEKSPSFTVSEERQMFHCFGCQKGGDVFTFLMEMEGLDFREALEVLSERTGVVLEKTENGKQKTEHGDGGDIDKKRLYELLELSVKFYEKQLWEGQGKEKALTYLKNRKIDDKTLKNFRIGFAPPGWENIKKFLLSQGYSDGEIRLSGLLVEKEGGRSYDRFRERIMFPIFDALGRVVGYSARALPGSDEEGAKYINTPETLVYHKSRAIYGLFEAKQAIKEKQHVVVVEGNMDVLAMHKTGFENTVAVSGTALTQEHLKILKRYAQEILFFFDMDSAGQSAALKSVSLACSLDVPSKMVTLSEGKDAADMALSNEEGLQEALTQARHSVEYFFSVWEKENDMTSVKGKRNFSERSLELIASLVNEVEISHWMAYVSDCVGVEIHTVYDMLSRYKNREKVFHQASQQEQFEEEQGSFEDSSRETALSLRVLMFFFSFPNLWKWYDTQENSSLRIIHPSFQDVLRLGRSCEYSYEALRMRLEDSMRKVLEKAYHDFQMEVLTKILSEDEARREIDFLFEQIQKEQKKSILEGIEKELYEAEKSNDKHRAKELRAKMNQMIQQA